MSQSIFPGVRGAQSRALLAPGQQYEGVQPLESMDGVPATNIAAQPHEWRKQLQPEAIISAVVRTTPTDLLREVAPPLAVNQLIIERIVNFMPNVVMSEQAPGSQAPPIRHTSRRRRFVLKRYAITVSLNAETAATPEGRRLVLAQLGSMAQSALNTMEMLILGTLMRSEETASSIANQDMDKTQEERKRETIDYFKQVGCINKDPARFINCVESMKRLIQQFGARATVAIVPTGLMQRLSGTNDYNKYSTAGRARDLGKGVPDYSRMCGLRVIEHSDCGMDTRGNLQRMLRRSILVGEWYPAFKGQETHLFDANVGDWRLATSAGRGDGIIIRNFITLETSSVIIAKGGSDFASMAFRLATSMSGMNAGTMGGIQQFAMHARPCVWRPWECAILNDVVVHGCTGGADTAFINDGNPAHDDDVELEKRAVGGGVKYSDIIAGKDAEVKKLSGSCLFWPLDTSALVQQVPRIFDVTGLSGTGPTSDTAKDTAVATRMGLQRPSQPKSNGFAWTMAMNNSCVVLGSYKLRPDGKELEDHPGQGPLSGLEYNMHL
jgi:hypothetical protein